MGRIFDDRGNVMGPSHAKKNGVRYRYYVSRAMVEARTSEAGSVPRVSAPDVERIVCEALRDQFTAQAGQTDRDLIEQHVEKIIVHSQAIEVVSTDLQQGAITGPSQTMSLPFNPFHLPRKGLVHEPTTTQVLSPETRQTLLQAIARSRVWLKTIMAAPATTLDSIAAAEGVAERHIRFLLSLALLSPRIIAAIVDGTAPADMTVTGLARALPHRWSEQDERILHRA